VDSIVSLSIESTSDVGFLLVSWSVWSSRFCASSFFDFQHVLESTYLFLTSGSCWVPGMFGLPGFVLLPSLTFNGRFMCWSIFPRMYRGDWATGIYH
jgi:hypothetical protein